MAIGKEDVVAVRASEARHADVVKSVADKAADPSVTLITETDGTHKALIKLRGRFVEMPVVTVIDLRV